MQKRKMLSNNHEKLLHPKSYHLDVDRGLPQKKINFRTLLSPSQVHRNDLPHWTSVRVGRLAPSEFVVDLGLFFQGAQHLLHDDGGLDLYETDAPLQLWSLCTIPQKPFTLGIQVFHARKTQIQILGPCSLPQGCVRASVHGWVGGWVRACVSGWVGG